MLNTIQNFSFKPLFLNICLEFMLGFEYKMWLDKTAQLVQNP